MTEPRTKSHPTRFRALILDMDGVLWRADEPIGDLAAIFRRIRALDLKFALATNNSTRTSQQYLDKLSGFGVNLEPAQIITSASATASYLHTRYPAGGPVYIVGETGLRQALSEKGFWETEDNAQFVVAGLDRQLTYAKVMRAAQFIRQGAPFIATNSDNTLPTPHGPIPGAGSILAAIQAASGVAPTVIGKPGSEMYRLAQQFLDVPAPEILAVGDRLETDIAGAQSLGCLTALVLSGVSNNEMAQAWQPPPDFVTADLANLLDRLETMVAARKIENSVWKSKNH